MRIFLPLICSLLLSVQAANALTTSEGQSWDYEPDAWIRGNGADTSWFGWDSLEAVGPPTAPYGSYLLSDSTPDLGSPTTATGASLAQSVSSQGLYGHRSSSGNYYSGFLATMTADDSISGVAPASGAGGNTTLVLQVLAMPPDPVQGSVGLEGLSFDADAAWAQTAILYGMQADGTGLYWIEWTAAGAAVPFSIQITSQYQHVAIDAFQVDTYWTSGSAPVTNSLSSIGVPEPASWLLYVAAALTAAGRRR